MKKTTLILFFIFAFCLFTFHLKAQWVQQTLPQSGTPYDMVFFDANTGIITMNTTPPTIYRTTDAGSNWTFINYIRIFTLNKIDTQAVYGNGRTGGNDIIFRSYNKGLTWDSVSSTPAAYSNLSFISRDTGWVCGHDGNFGAIWKTTNAGITLSEELSSGTSGMDRIFFLKQKVNNEFIGWCSQGNIFRKTTNSGVNWFVSAPITASNKIYFINKDTGWICNSGMFKCTDGGVNWINEPMPTDGSFVFNSMNSFVYVGNNILYGVGGVRFFGGGQFRGVIWKTTNAGLNWGYLQPDTAIHIFNYSVIDFTDSLIGWAYNGTGNSGIHTTNGGGQIIFTPVTQISCNTPSEFILFQNYPNPFNPVTNIKYQIVNSKYVILKVYDITGKEVAILVNQKQNAGTYQVDFSENNLPSGVYFYSLIIGGVLMGVKKMVLIK